MFPDISDAMIVLHGENAPDVSLGDQTLTANIFRPGQRRTLLERTMQDLQAHARRFPEGPDAHLPTLLLIRSTAYVKTFYGPHDEPTG